MNKNGFTLMELVVAVAVASGLAAVAVPSYQNYVAKTQAAEAEKLINAERVNLVSSMQKGHCLAPGAQSTQKGRFGTLTTSGTFVASKGLSCDSGCDVTYTFNADANKHIAGKKIVVDMRLNGDISKNASTTVDQRYLSDNLNRAGTVAAGDDCTALSNTKPTATAGSGASGTETGAAAPPPPANGGNAGNNAGNNGNGGGNGGNNGNGGGNAGSGGGPVAEELWVYHGSNDIIASYQLGTTYGSHSNRILTFSNGVRIKDFEIRHFGDTVAINFRPDIGNPPKSITLRLKNNKGLEQVMNFKNAYGENANGVYVGGASVPIWVYNNITPRLTSISIKESSKLKKFLSPEVYAYLVDYEP